jgi:menaquinone-dependent protoporphyrinogen oxidase
MPESRVLILFSTSYGHTAQVAERLASRLRQRGFAVDVRRVEQLPPSFSLEPYRAVLLGGAVYFNRFPKALRAFATARHQELARLPAGFFSVGFAGASPLASDRERAREDFERFARETGWRPQETAFLGGAVEYTRYGRPLRWFTWMFGRWQGARDTRRDYDYTDWSAVNRFGDHFADGLEPPRQPAPPPVRPSKPSRPRPRA